MKILIYNDLKNKVRQLEIDSKLFTYVEPKNLTPTWEVINLEIHSKQKQIDSNITSVFF